MDFLLQTSGFARVALLCNIGSFLLASHMLFFKVKISTRRAYTDSQYACRLALVCALFLNRIAQLASHLLFLYQQPHGNSSHVLGELIFYSLMHQAA